jgi:hypothetical protein
VSLKYEGGGSTACEERWGVRANSWSEAYNNHKTKTWKTEDAVFWEVGEVYVIMCDIASAALS